MPTPRASLIRRALVVLAVGLMAAGCATDVVKDYGGPAKTNFEIGCMQDWSTSNGKPKETALAPKHSCDCVYDYISNKKHQLDFGDLTTYESAVADAAPGHEPAPPKLLTKALAVCQKSGPAVPKSSTTSTGG